MIVARYALGVIFWQDGGYLWASDDGEPNQREEERIARLFSEPAPGREADATEDGTLIDTIVDTVPGTPEHARAVLYQLPHVEIVLDEGETAEG